MEEKKERQAIAETLFCRASELYGPERAQALRPNLEQMAQHLWLLSTQAPPPEVEPRFFV